MSTLRANTLKPITSGNLHSLVLGRRDLLLVQKIKQGDKHLIKKFRILLQIWVESMTLQD
jgi:hypothetical protein